MPFSPDVPASHIILKNSLHSYVSVCVHVCVCGLGMSTCPEVIVARHGQRPMRCVGLSLVTNHCAMDYDNPDTVDHDDVLQIADKRAADLQRFVSTLIERICID